MLSDEAKRSMYDVGLYNPLEDEDEVRISWFLVSGFLFFLGKTMSFGLVRGKMIALEISLNFNFVYLFAHDFFFFFFNAGFL